MASPPKRTPFEAERDRNMISVLYAQRLTQEDIAKVLNEREGITYTLSRQTVSRDIRVIIRKWEQEAIFNIDAERRKILLTLDAMESEAWMAWRKSLRGKNKAQRVEYSRTKRGALEKGAEKKTATKEESFGDPRYLAIIDSCVDKRAKLLGLYAPLKVEHRDIVNEIPWDNLSKDQLRGIIQAKSIDDIKAILPQYLSN